MLRLFFGLITVLLWGCTEATSHFPVSSVNQEKTSQEIDAKIISLTSKNIGNYYRTSRRYSPTNLPNSIEWSYKLGVGDIVSVAVFGHPDLALPAGDGDKRLATGFRIQSDGTIHYPYIGEVKAEGRSVRDLRSEISQRLRSYLTDPQVDVRVIEYNSQAVVVSGEVKSPNRQPLTAVPLTLLQAVNFAGGWTEAADISRITLRRAGKTYRIDLRGFLEANLKNNNPVLRAGDVVHVPETENLEAFVMGEVVRTQAVDLSHNLVSLTEAVNDAGGPRQVRSDARGVFVFRLVKGEMNVFQLNTQSPSGWLLGTKFTLLPQDVVYITTSPLQLWNDTIDQILPSVSAISVLEDLQSRF